MLLVTKRLLFPCTLMLHMVLQVESNITSINRTIGQETCVEFKFESLNNSRMDVSVNSLMVHRDGKKVEGSIWTNSSCPQSSTSLEAHTNCTFYIVKTSSREFSLYFPNLCKTDMGVYQLTLYVENQQIVLIESNRVNLTVYPGGNVTADLTPPFRSNNDSREMNQSEMTTKILVFSTLVITPVFVLAGLLGGFYWTYNRKTDDTPAHSSRSQQRRCQVHRTVPAVSTIEYGVLDFHKQQERLSHTEAQKAQEGVEYATILYLPQRKRT